jgi:hypothetical protein
LVAIQAEPPVQITTGDGFEVPDGMYKSSLCPAVPGGSAAA